MLLLSLSLALSIKPQLQIPVNVLIGTSSQFNLQIANYVSLKNGEGYLLASSKNITKTFIFQVLQISLTQKQSTGQKKYYAFFSKKDVNGIFSAGYQAVFLNNEFYIDQSKEIPFYVSTTITDTIRFNIPVVQSKFYDLTVFVSKEDGTLYFKASDAYNFTTKIPTLFSTKSDISALPKNFQPRQSSYYYYGLFYEIIQYKGQKVIWMAVYNKLKNKKSFSKPGWMGILYGSKSITDSDCSMIQYKLNKNGAISSASVQDSRIFGGGWPFLDISKLLNATNDIVYTYSSTSQQNSAESYRIPSEGLSKQLQTFLVSFYRYYDTKDSSGDIVIEERANYKICMAFNMMAREKEELVDCIYINTIGKGMLVFLIAVISVLI